MSDKSAGRLETPNTTPVVPSLLAFGTGGVLAVGFGAGYGAQSYGNSNVYKELIEKFPEPPSAEAEALARSGAARALFAGTGLAALMGVGAVALARSYGIRTIDDLADEARRWLPSKSTLQGGVDKLEPLQRTISENLQSTRTKVADRFQQSKVGATLREKATEAAHKRGGKLEDWEIETWKRVNELLELDKPVVPETATKST